MVNALITGIAGFAGSHLAELLLAKGYRVAGLDRTVERAENLQGIRHRLELHACDLRDSDRVKEIISSVKPDEIYHLAAMAHVPTSFSDVRLTFDVNLNGTLNVLEGIREASVATKVLYVGTASEYGAVRDTDIPTHEDVPFRPVDPYGVSKAAADMLAYQYHKSYGLHIVRVRPFNHVGPRQSPEYLVASLARQVAQIEKGLVEPVLAVGNLESRRDLTDVRDMVLGYQLAIRDGEAGEVYNICSEEAVSVREVLDRLLSMTGTRMTVRQDPNRLRASDVPLVLGDCTRFRERTGWKTTIPLATTLRDTLEYWRATVR